MTYREELRGERLWLPLESDFNRNSDWLDKNYKRNVRNEQILVNADNVLTPEGIKQVQELKHFLDISFYIISDVFYP